MIDATDDQPPDTERMPAFVATDGEAVALFRAVETYANGNVEARIEAMDELTAVIETIVRRRTRDVYTG